MTFLSILWDKRVPDELPAEPPDIFPDLNLDYVVEAITKSKKAYDLGPFFWAPLRDAETVLFRQEVFRDLEDLDLVDVIKDFAAKMTAVRRFLSLAEETRFEYHRKGWLLEAALVYCRAVEGLLASLEETGLRSRGLKAFRDFLSRYTSSTRFRALATDARDTKAQLEGIHYCVTVGGGRVKVKRYEGETDYSQEIERIFRKFKQNESEQDRLSLVIPKRTGMSHVEAKILEFVAKLYPQAFASLDRFCASHVPFLDETVTMFDREIQFYVAYLDFISTLRSKGLPFCYPEVSTSSKEECVRDSFDIALAYSLAQKEWPVVLNGYDLHGPERIIVVTGPNQGGKTTFARMYGQLHYLASLGLPVPGREACLFLPDRIFTHFEKREEIETLRGKLEDDLVRIHDALQQASARSLFVLNEIFSSTTLRDAAFLSREIMARISDLDALAVWVTFVDELASFNEKTVSMVATVDPEDPVVRTFKIVRRPADGLAYALSLARKWGLTYEELKERIG